MILNSPTISGSLTVTGNIIASGSITISGSIASASYATNADLLDGLDSTAFATTGAYSATSASLYATSASLSATSGSLSTASGSFNTRVATIESKYATTGSNTFIGTQVVSGSILQSGSFTTTGTIIAQTINVQTITSSVVYSSGSNVFGNALNNTQTFTGSVLITGSLTIAGGSSASSYSGATIYGSTAVCSPVGLFSGCVGIGTSTPTQLLQVYSNISSSSNVTAEFYNGDYGTGTRNFIRLRNGATIASTTSAYIGQGQDQKTYIYNNDPSRPGDIVITNAGKVGIGISSPIAQLHVKAFDCIQTTNLCTAYTSAKFRLDTYCGSGQGISMGNIGGYYQYIQGQYSDGATTNPLIVNPFGGNVGINRTDSNYNLDISDNTGGTLNISNRNSSATVCKCSALLFSGYDTICGEKLSGAIVGESDTSNYYGGHLKFLVSTGNIYAASSLTEAMRITSAGNVGIGTLSPGGALDVVTCSNSTQNFYLRNTNNLDASSRAYFNVVAGNTSLSLLALAGGGSCGGTYIAGTTGADMYFQQAPGSTVNMIIKSNGSLGVGLINPSAQLHICSAYSQTPLVVQGGGNGNVPIACFMSGPNQIMLIDDNANLIIGGCSFSTRGTSSTGGLLVSGKVGIGTASPRTQLDVGDIHDGVGGTTFCAFLVAQGVWATFACVTNGDTNVITDITFVNNNDYNRSGAFYGRWAYLASSASLGIVNCAYNWVQNVTWDLRNNGGALQICLGGGGNGYRVQARVQGSRATG